MNAKKFLVVILLFGLLRICHAASEMPLAQNTFQLPPSGSSSITVSPCLTCSPSIYANTGTLAETIQGGIQVKLLF